MTIIEDLTVARNLIKIWPSLNASERRRNFFALSRNAAEELFASIHVHDRKELLENLSSYEMRSWLRFLAPDDAADFIQRFPKDKQSELLSLLDEPTKYEVLGLLAYAEDNAGGLMNSQYIRLRPQMTVAEAIGYLRAQAKINIKIYYAYVLDPQQKLLGTVSLKELLLQPADKTINEFMRQDFVSVLEDMHSEEVTHLFSRYNKLMAIPVVDLAGKMKGIVTYDDVASVREKETTEDIHKLGGMEALGAPYFKVSFLQMIKKRAGWLTILFLGEMLTATAMTYFESEIAKAVVLALFVPLIISSGGNSGSQASTLIIRSLVLKEIRLTDWPKVLLRELRSGVVLGCILGSIGLLRILAWQQWGFTYGEHYVLIGLTVAFSLIGVVVWGTLSGSMLPFILYKVGFDPASASAPFVATLVDVAGLIIYFSIARFLLAGSLL